jgi:uncharacterized protein YgbK (DUF1537 family)
MTRLQQVRLLADDLTGALDSAAAFGPGATVHLDRPGSGPADSAAVSVVATATRDVVPTRLPELLSACVPWLAGAGLAFKKVDSLLRGNTLAELRWLAAAGGFGRVVFAPALPAQGRYTLGERLAVAPPDGPVAQAESRGENLRQALLSGPWPADCELRLPEVRGDEDLERLTELLDEAGPRTLWCGSAGLAAAVARHVGRPDAAPSEPGCPSGWSVPATSR